MQFLQRIFFCVLCFLICIGQCLIYQFLINRWNLESVGVLEFRRSVLEDDFEEDEEKEEDEMDVDVEDNEKV